MPRKKHEPEEVAAVDTAESVEPVEAAPAPIPAPANSPRVTVEELVALYRSVRAIISADHAAAKEAAALAALEWIDRELDDVGLSLVNGVLVPHGSTFNENSGKVDDPDPAPGDRVWSKSDGWTVAPPKAQ
jgi:hypothetical protein